MNIVDAYRELGSFRAAGVVCGVDHKTVKAVVERAERGEVAVERRQPPRGHNADVAHERIVAMGFDGSDRTTRRAVADAKAAYRAGRRRVYRPWITEPGMWLQFDWGTGPTINGRPTLLFCAWLAWSRYRVVIPVWDRTLGTLLACLDRALRIVGGAPTYVLTDNERTVTIERIAGVGIRHPELMRAGRHYGVTVLACEPADPESKGGSENTVKLAKARPGTHRRQPARRVRDVRAAGSGVRGVVRQGQRPGAP